MIISLVWHFLDGNRNGVLKSFPHAAPVLVVWVSHNLSDSNSSNPSFECFCVSMRATLSILNLILWKCCLALTKQKTFFPFYRSAPDKVWERIKLLIVAGHLYIQQRVLQPKHFAQKPSCHNKTLTSASSSAHHGLLSDSSFRLWVLQVASADLCNLWHTARSVAL